MQSTGIHCKVICNDQIRRFQFSGTEFSSLQDQVRKLLGLTSEFVLKYKDNENDMITISSTEELSCAIDISQKNDGGLIRLTVFSVEPTSVTSQIPPNTVPQPEHSREFCHRGRGRGGRWGGNGRWSREGGPPNEQVCKKRFERRRAKLTFKRDMWKAYLSSLEQSGELSPEDERRKQMFQAKVERVEAILADFSLNPGSPSDPLKEPLIPPNELLTGCPAKEKHDEFYPPKDKCARKIFAKKERKCRRKEYKKQVKNSLSEEEKVEIRSLKSQIKVIKPSIWAIQEQLKAKKSEIYVAYQTGQEDKIPELKSEIKRLKEEKMAKKAEIDPLRQRVHQLKSGH
jgi:hypothetical protein